MHLKSNILIKLNFLFIDLQKSQVFHRIKDTTTNKNNKYSLKTNIRSQVAYNIYFCIAGFMQYNKKNE